MVAFNLDADVAALSLVVAPALAFGAFVFGRRLKRISRKQREARSDVISFVQQTLGAIPLVQLFTSEPRNRERYSRLSEVAVETTKRAKLLDAGYILFHGVTTTGGVAIISVGAETEESRRDGIWHCTHRVSISEPSRWCTPQVSGL